MNEATMLEYENVIVHTNTEHLTYHESVICSEILPLVVDFDDKKTVGRAKVKWDEGRTQLTADLFMDDDAEDLDLTDPLIAIVAAQGIKMFKSENGTTYAMDGCMSQVSVLTEDALSAMNAQTWQMDGELLGVEA